MQIEPNRKMRHTKGKKSKKKKLWLGMILSFFLFSALAAGAVWWKLEDTLSNITADSETTLSEEETDNQKPANYNKEPISMVIVGRDSREGLGLMNTDVIIVAAINPETKHVTMMSLPRDTGVKIPGYKGYHKINSVYAKGEAERRAAEKSGKPVTETGTTLLRKTIEEALGIPIQHYAMIDFEGFEKVVDKLGGVELEVDASMKYDDPTDGTHINLQPGLQVLEGKQALGFVRHRLDNRGSKYYSSDFDRGRRQQVVIKAMVDKMKSFTGISSFFGVMNVAGDHIRTDLSKDQIKGLVLDFKSVGSESIASLESGAYWNKSISQNVIPKEKIEQIQLAFQQEMGIEGGEFHSSLRVEAPAAEKPIVVTKKPPKEAAAAPIEETPKGDQNKQVNEKDVKPELQPPTEPTEKPETSTEDSNGSTEPSTSTGEPSQPVVNQPNDQPTTPPTDKVEDSATQSTPAPSKTEQGGMLQQPMNATPVTPSPEATVGQ